MTFSPGCKLFTEEHWVDFVRGLTPPQLRQDMEQHLAAGCPSCAAQARWLGILARSAPAAADVPADVLHRALSIFPPRENWMDRLQVLVAELISSSSLDWQPAGVRNVATGVHSPRERLLYRAGIFLVDLRVDARPASAGGGEIVGQVSTTGNTGEDLEGTVIRIGTAARMMGETSANQFGEFLIPYRPAPSLMLSIALRRHGQRIDIPMPGKKRPSR